MAKRFYKPCDKVESKKPRLDVTTSQKFLPLSQNIKPSSTKGTINDSEAMWGDDNDDEILLQVSQAYEEVSDIDTSMLPDYSNCMKPRLTSTQLSMVDGHSNIGKFNYLKWGDRIAQQPLIRIPANGSIQCKNNSFKKPTAMFIPRNSKANGTIDHLPISISVYKESLSMNRLPQQEPEVTTKGYLEATKQQLDVEKEILEELGLGNVSVNDNNQCILKQLVELRKENDKFKMEQNKLLDRCVTKEGEVSILRAQLKSAAGAAEAARLQRIHAHEQQQRQWGERLNAAQIEAKGMQAELEFKNMEISKMKEKCKQSESNRMKVVPNELPKETEKRGFFQRLNNSFTSSEKRNKIICPSVEIQVQTDCLLTDERLHIPLKESFSLKDTISEKIFDTPKPENKPFLNFAGDSFANKYNGCSLFKRKLLNVVPSVKRICRKNSSYCKMDSFYKDLVYLIKQPDQSLNKEECRQKCQKIGLLGKEMLIQTREHLRILSGKINLSMLKKMDELYLQYTSPNADLNMDFDFFSSRSINDKEQCIELRRILMVVAALCPHSSHLSTYVLGHRRISQSVKTVAHVDSEGYLLPFLDICRHIGNMGCADIYSGVLSSISEVIHGSILHAELNESQISTLFDVIKELVFSRPPAITIKYLLKPISRLSSSLTFLNAMCQEDVRPLRIDLSQGVATYTKDNCFIYILSSQVKVCLKQLEVSQDYIDETFDICWHLLTLAYNSSLQRVRWSYGTQDVKCHCPVKFVQCVVLALKLSVSHYKDKHVWTHDKAQSLKFKILLSEGLMMLYLWSLRDVEFLIKLGEYEGYYQMFVETCKELEHTLLLDNIHSEALADLSGSLEASSDSEDAPDAGLGLWEQSLKGFHRTD